MNNNNNNPEQSGGKKGGKKKIFSLIFKVYCTMYIFHKMCTVKGDDLASVSR